MANRDGIPRTTPAEIENLIQQIRAANLDPGSKDKIERLLLTVLTLVELLQRRNTSIKKLREMIFGRRTEKHHAKKFDGADKKSESGTDQKESPKAPADRDTAREQNSIAQEEKLRRKGHGHRAMVVAAAVFSYGRWTIRRVPPARPETGAARPALGQFAAPLIAAVTAFALATCGCGNHASKAPSRTSHASVLPRDLIIPLSTVKEVLPEMSRETATGQDETAVGNPTGARSVTYATADGPQRVVISVDQYQSPQDASSAYQQAFQMSQEVPGVKGEPVSDLGQRAFIGVATQGNETHVGGGALYGDLIVTVTLQGYDGTKENRTKVMAIIRKQAAAKRAP
jgi:hypothetical protein